MLRSVRIVFAALAGAVIASTSVPAAAQDAARPAGSGAKSAVPTPSFAPRAPSASIADVRRLSDAFSDVAERVSPSVVQIDVVVGGDTNSQLRWFRNDNVQRGLGSGVIFSSDGAILTNNHVIEDARSINVRLRDGRIFPGRVVGRDPSTDLAVLRIDVKGLSPANFADSDAARVGEWVLAIGSPFGLGHTVTTGVLSAKGRGGVGVNVVEDYLQTDASINPGNSGGPLVNLDGQVLGINTMIVSRGQGIGLAVPASMAKRVAEQILKIGRVDRAWIGIGIQDLTPQLAAEIPSSPSAGALVNAITPSGPASKSHLEPGDVISTIGGKQVRDAQDVIREVFVHNVGDELTFEVVRAGKHYQTKVKLESRNEPAPQALPMERQPPKHPGLGISLRDIADPQPTAGANVAKTLAQITGVTPDSTADRAGVRPGDIVLEADGVQSPTSAQVQSAAQDGHVLLRLRRQSSSFYTPLRR